MGEAVFQWCVCSDGLLLCQSQVLYARRVETFLPWAAGSTTWASNDCVPIPSFRFLFWGVSIDLEPIETFIYLDLVRKGEEIEIQVRCPWLLSLFYRLKFLGGSHCYWFNLWIPPIVSPLPMAR